MPRYLARFAWSLGILVGSVVVLYLLALAINLRDRPPSVAARQIRSLLDDRPPVASADNAFLYFLGFSATGGVKPEDAGAVRAAWIDAVNLDPSLRRSPPGIEDASLEGEAFPTLGALRKECSLDNAPGCRDAFDRLAAGPEFTAAELEYLGRYGEMLTRRQWRETYPFDPRISLPRYSDVLSMQRLMHLDLRRRAQAESSPAIRASLQADLVFWREMQQSSDYLITKMIANAGIAQHFLLGNLVIRSLPPAEQATALPEGWTRALSAKELDLHQVMAGEHRFSEAMMRHVTEGGGGVEDEITEEQLNFFDRAAWALSRPFFQPQDYANRLAQEHLDLARRFQQPLERYPALAAEARANAERKPSWSLYNPVGQSLLSVSTDMTGYVLRVGALEGMRRAALATATLRAGGIPADDMASHLQESELRNPFDGQPFAWDSALGAVVFTGPESGARRQIYFH